MRSKYAMTPAELTAIIEEVYGYRQANKLAADIGKGEVTVSRWANKVTPIGDTEALLIRLILLLHRRGFTWQRWLSEYMGEVPAKHITLEDIL